MQTFLFIIPAIPVVSLVQAMFTDKCKGDSYSDFNNKTR